MRQKGQGLFATTPVAGGRRPVVRTGPATPEAPRKPTYNGSQSLMLRTVGLQPGSHLIGDLKSGRAYVVDSDGDAAMGDPAPSRVLSF